MGNNSAATAHHANGKGLAIGVVHSRFNEAIVTKMTAACVSALHQSGVEPDAVELLSVPGALEIPLALQAMALTHKYDALIAIGAVVRGETYHFEIVANESCRGVMDVMLETGVPVANGILTVDTEAQALARVEEKGADCAKVAVEMARRIADITEAGAR